MLCSCRSPPAAKEAARDGLANRRSLTIGPVAFWAGLGPDEVDRDVDGSVIGARLVDPALSAGVLPAVEFVAGAPLSAGVCCEPAVAGALGETLVLGTDSSAAISRAVS